MAEEQDEGALAADSIALAVYLRRRRGSRWRCPSRWSSPSPRELFSVSSPCLFKKKTWYHCFAERGLWSLLRFLFPHHLRVIKLFIIHFTRFRTNACLRSDPFGDFGSRNKMHESEPFRRQAQNPEWSQLGINKSWPPHQRLGDFHEYSCTSERG